MGYAQPKRQGCKQRSKQLKQSCLFCLKRVCVVLSIMRLGVISAEPTLSIHKCCWGQSILLENTLECRNRLASGMSSALLQCFLFSLLQIMCRGHAVFSSLGPFGVVHVQLRLC